MKPKNVNPQNFKVENILFNNGEFSIAYGIWEDGKKYLAMRWNGDNENDSGYPKAFGNPMWFILTDELTIPILKSLINIPNVCIDPLIQTIAEKLLKNN